VIEIRHVSDDMFVMVLKPHRPVFHLGQQGQFLTREQAEALRAELSRALNVDPPPSFKAKIRKKGNA
jgi:hypothetical protein